MRKLLPFGALGAAVLVIVVAVPSCKTATAIRAHYTTDFGCKDGYLERKVMFSVSRTGEALVFDGRDPNDADSCVPGPRATVGDGQGLVLRPNESANPRYDGTYELVAIVGTDGTTEASCNLGPDGKPKGDLGGEKCVVARRKVRFVSGSEVTQNVFLSSRCAGVLCPEGRTCNPATRLCAEVTENVEDESGGNPATPETDGGAPPIVDAGVADATIEPPPPVLPCVALNPVACVGQVTIGARSGLAPDVVAHEGKIAFVRDTAGTAHVATYDFAFPTNLPTDIDNPLDATPKLTAFGFVGTTKRSSLLAVFEGPSILGNGFDLEAFDTATRTPWTSVVGSGGNSGFPHLLSDGELYAGFVVGPLPQGETAPFARSSGGTFLKRGSESFVPQVTPFVGALGTAPRFVWASSKGIVSIGQDENGPQETHTPTLPTLPARLVAFGPGNRVVAIDGTNHLVLLGNGALSTTMTILADVSREVVAADGKRIYVVVGKDANTARLYAIDKATLASRAPSMCEVTNPTGVALERIVLDATCVYLTTKTRFGNGNSTPTFSVSRTPLVPTAN